MTTKAVPEGKYADIGDGLQIHYQEEGQGPAVVFFHGSGPGASGWSNFRRNYPVFAKAGFRTVVVDTLGFGYSSKPDVDYGMDFLVGAVHRFFDKVGIEKASLVGNSHGGAVALKFALDHADRVSKLVLMAPGGLEEREAYMKMEGIRVMMKAYFGKEGITREGLRNVFGLQLYDQTYVTDELIEERYQIALTQPKRVMASLLVPHLAPELPKLAMPVLGFWGTGDKFCPVSGAMRMAEGCPSSRVLVLSKCGHWVMVEYTDLFNKLSIEFLQEPERT
jgi:4,5:9,10-diseco-3-hydroxy-5,9,17-trioxoandrosta-1(10),2-diene-4-oate hydrolase